MMKLKGKEVSDYKNDCRFRDENIDDFKATFLALKNLFLSMILNLIFLNYWLIGQEKII